MEKMKLYEKCFSDEQNTLYQLEYSLVVRSAEQGKVYGVAVQKTDHEGEKEEAFVEGLCEIREEAEAFLFRLAEGLVFPVTLTALCDDYIYAKEEKNTLNQAAS